MTFYADADRYYGADRVWAIGSKVEGETYDLILKFLDWYASPEGMTFQHVGIEGLNYTKNEDGTFTKLHDDALALNLEVPEACAERYRRTFRGAAGRSRSYRETKNKAHESPRRTSRPKL